MGPWYFGIKLLASSVFFIKPINEEPNLSKKQNKERKEKKNYLWQNFLITKTKKIMYKNVQEEWNRKCPLVNPGLMRICD